MTPLKDMYEQLVALQNKEKKTTETVEEINRLQNDIQLRERYLHRYINHPPMAVNALKDIIENEFTGMPNNAETRYLISQTIQKTVHSWLVSGKVWGRPDEDDLVFYLEKSLELK